MLLIAFSSFIVRLRLLVDDLQSEVHLATASQKRNVNAKPQLTCIKMGRKPETYNDHSNLIMKALRRTSYEKTSLYCPAAPLAALHTYMGSDKYLARWTGRGNTYARRFKKIIDRQDPRFVIVDARSPAEYAGGHIPTAVNIPGGVTADIKAPPSKDKYIVVYCHGGMKAPAACEKMLADGYKHVFVWGGIVNWPYPKETSSK